MFIIKDKENSYQVIGKTHTVLAGKWCTFAPESNSMSYEKNHYSNNIEYIDYNICLYIDNPIYLRIIEALIEIPCEFDN